ncbi:MAG: murein biosynthesis integral membrane protein MurJ [Spirochaetota bacterium]
MDNTRIAKSAFSMSLVTFISRIFGLVREWLRGYLLGTSWASDAFSIAFMFPNLLRRLVGEGALTAAFIPVFSDYLHKKNKKERDHFISSFFTVDFLFLVSIVVITIIFAPLLKFFLPEFTEVPGKIELTVFLTRLMFPYIFLISLAALTQAILNAYRIFVPSATTPILLNISIITIGLLFGTRLRNPAIALGIGVLAGGVLQLGFQMPFLLKKNITYSFELDFTNPGVKKVFFLMIPGAIGAGVYQINALVSYFIAATLEGGSVAALRFSNTLVEVVLGVFVISISTVILPVLSEKSTRGDTGGMKQHLNFAFRLVFLITIPSTVGFLVLRFPIINMLFKYGRFGSESAHMVAYALIFHSLGLVGIGGTRLLVQLFYSMKDTRTPVYIAALAMAVNLALCYLLSGPLRLGGIALAATISAYVNFLLLLVVAVNRLGRIIDRKVMVCFGKSIVAALCMAVVLYFALQGLSSLMEERKLYMVVFTLVLLAVGVVVFFFMNIVLKNYDVVELKNILLKKLGLSSKP